ncbi:hypothetical protein Ddc_13489 [Ditylenchus destructor]|nr:hypothetical protein Ddc_13489 [Ditylenchus destructor]
MSYPSKDFEKDHPVAAQTIQRFQIRLGISCAILVVLVAPIVTIILVIVRIISPWWLFLGCGQLALALCAGCCFVCAKIAFDHLFEGLCETDGSLTQSASV